MRSRSLIVVAAVWLLAGACSDVPPTGAGLARHTGPMSNVALADYIDAQILELLPTGLETSVAARWSTVKRTKNRGDLAGAVKHLNTLSAWLVEKTGGFTPPDGVEKVQATALLITNMARWVHDGGNAPIATIPTGDVVIEVVPAGDPLFMQTPSQHAGVSWSSGSTQEDRIVVLAEDPTPYPGHCAGPLQTRRCQYPLFYILESYPNLKLTQPGRFAVCMVETGDRRPLEHPEDETGGRPIDARMRVAHDKPDSPADYTPGATQEDGIEILPKSESQTGELVHCDEPDPQAMGRVERAMYVASKWIAKFVSPKNAYAFDSGPEHDFSSFSNFNGVDPESEPDLAVVNLTATAGVIAGNGATVSYVVENRSRRSDGDATATSAPTTVSAYLSSDAELDEGDLALGSAAVPALLPDAPGFPVSHSFTPAAAGSYYLIVSVAEAASEVTLDNNLATQSFLVSAPPPAEAEQLTIDGEVGPLGIGGGPLSQQILAQVFTAPRSGTLTEVAFPVGCSSGSTLVVEIHLVSEGIPTGQVLARQFAPASSLVLPEIAPTAFRRIPFASPTTVNAAQQYAIVLKTRDLDEESCGVQQGPVGDPYTGGDAYFDARPNTAGIWVALGSRKDLPFKTVVHEDLIDQINDPETGSSGSCGNGSGLSLFQSFTPGASVLTAVELRMRDGGSFPAQGAASTIHIRSGSPTGSIIGTATAFIAPASTGTQRLLRFYFPSLPLTPGSTYVIELEQIDATTLTWMQSGDTYPGGIKYVACGGTPVAVPTEDWNFITYR
ncbi:MAG: hypothetical protein WD801_12725 [Gemmatimonadaceae bacterium]